MTRNDVNVGVREKLTGRQSVVDTDVETIGMVAFLEFLAYFARQSPERFQFPRRNIEDRCDMPVGHDECMSDTNWIGIHNCKCVFVLQPNRTGCHAAKRTRLLFFRFNVQHTSNPHTNRIKIIKASDCIGRIRTPSRNEL